MISIYPIPALTDNYIWAIVNAGEGLAILVDPGEANPALYFLQEKNLKLAAILLTHHHWDHSNGVLELLRFSSVPVIASFESPHAYVTKRLSDGEELSLTPAFPSIKAITLPGHTLDHLGFLIQNALFSGDTLFAGGCGRLFEGSYAQLYASLQKIAALPLDTLIYSGHEYTLKNLSFAQNIEPNNPCIKEKIKKVTQLRKEGFPSLPSSLKEELATNPFLRCEEPLVIKAVESHAQGYLKTPVEVFTELRRWKDHW